MRNPEIDLFIPLRLAELSKNVPQEVLDSCKRAYHAMKLDNEPDSEDLKAVENFNEAYFAPLLKPGQEEVQNVKKSDYKPVGQADGVIFFNQRPNPDPDAKGHLKILEPSKERQAMLYLRPADALYLVEHGLRYGMNQHKIEYLYQYCYGIRAYRDEITAEAAKTKQPVVALFRTCKRGINAVQKPFSDRWVVRKAEEGVWAIFYI